LAQHFGDGQAREKVPAGSSACNDRVHRMVESDCAAGGSSSALLDVNLGSEAAQSERLRRFPVFHLTSPDGAADPPVVCEATSGVPSRYAIAP
jgi:hypothetical protein